jgi:hypothetical protein
MIAAATILMLAHHAASAQDDLSDDEAQRREIERRAAQRAYENRRVAVDQRDLDRRQNLYNDIKRDFRDFSKDGFDTVPAVRRRHAIPPIADSPDLYDRGSRLFYAFAQEAERLQADLTNNVDVIRGVRGVLSDVITFSANAQVLADRCRRDQRIGAMGGDFEAVHYDWQAISYKMRQIPQLAQSVSIQRVSRMDDLDRQLLQIFQIQPQFDQHELIEQTACLSRELQNLAQDINLQLVDTDQRRVLCSRARRAQSQVQSLCDSVDTGTDPNEVLAEFKQYQQVWYPLARDIRTVDGTRTLERGVLRINQSNHDISDLLRMPLPPDTGNLGYMMETLKKDIDEYFTRAPLKLLMELPDSRTALATAGEFYGGCEQFLQDTSSNAAQNDLADAFHHVWDAWHTFEHTFRPMNSEPARRVLNRIEEGINSIADALQVYDQQFDRRHASELAYTLASAAENIRRDTRQWVDRDGLDFSPDAIRETEAFARESQHFSDAIAANAPIEDLRQQVAKVYARYGRVFAFIRQCRGRERAILGENAYRTKNALVELRTLIEI